MEEGFCPNCDRELIFDPEEQTGEQVIICPDCDYEFWIKDIEGQQKYQYKVVEIKKKNFVTGALSTGKIEKLLNQYAEQGWILDRIVSGETLRFFIGDKDVFIIIFKRETI